MKLSIFTTASRPEERGDTFNQAMECYNDLADQVVLIDGNVPDTFWPKEFSWDFIGKQFQKGYEQASGDVVIHADLDFIFHEKDYDAIREACSNMLTMGYPAMSFWKYQFILPDRYTLKSRLVVAVNKAKYGDRIRFDSGGDLCQPSLDGKEIKPDSVPEAKIPFYNYEKLCKTEAQVKDDVGRMARAWQRHFGENKLGGPDDESAYQEWLKMTLGRFKGREHKRIMLKEHPMVIQDTIKYLNSTQFGYDGFGFLERNSYV